MKLKFYKGWALLVDDEGKPVTGKNWYEQRGLAEALSLRYKKKIAMMPVKKAYRLCKTSKAFKKLMEEHWIHNAEIFTKKGDLKKLLNLPKDAWIWGMYFEDGLSSVRSSWSRGEGCFAADSYGPSARSSNGLAVFEVKG